MATSTINPRNQSTDYCRGATSLLAGILPWRKRIRWRRRYPSYSLSFCMVYLPLITQLPDALEAPFEEWTDQSDLVHQAREATNEP